MPAHAIMALCCRKSFGAPARCRMVDARIQESCPSGFLGFRGRLGNVAGLLLLIPVTVAVAACGQVITRAEATSTPTATRAPTVAVATLRPTATPAPYTPAPTATPTITPTPVIYAIRRGDTLLAIASRFGVTIHDLQDVNGIVDPRSLQVGQELIIPTGEDVAEQTPTPAPTPVPFAVENVYFHRPPTGDLWVFGEILNNSGQDLEQAGVSVRLIDSMGQTVGEADAPAQMDLIENGDRAPFALRFEQPPRSFSTYLVRPTSGIRGYIGSYYRDLRPREVQGEGERYTIYTVSGNIANVGPEDAIDVIVTVTIYDALGRVIGARRGPPEYNVIPRGGEARFVFALTPAGGPVASYRVEALGRRVPTPTPTPG